jgi:DNA-binding NarL/FixJ family response regulator
MIRVAIADDHQLIREGIRRILAEQPDIQIIGEAADGNAAVALVHKETPDLILLDITMPQRDGIEATKAIAALQNVTKILILTIHTDYHYALRALRAGAHGFILKTIDPEELIRAIHAVYKGQRYLPQELTEDLVEDHLKPNSNKRLIETLSYREFQVIRLIASGLSNREIAQRLKISVKTVDTHRANVLKKLKLRNNVEITHFCLQNELSLE